MKDSKPKTDLWIILGIILVIAVLIIGLICHAFLSSDAEDSTGLASESAEESVNLEENTETADSVSSEAGSTYEEDQVLYDQDGIVIASTGESSLTEDAWQYGLVIENSSGKDLELTAEYGSVNGYMIDLSLSCEAPSGSETDTELEAGLDDLEEAGIETVMELEFYVELWDPEASEMVDLAGPITLTTDAYGTESQEYDDSGTLLYKENGMEIVFRQVEDADSAVYLNFYFENSTGEDISITIEDLLINDYSVSGNLLCSITDGKRVVDHIALSYDVLSGYGIEQADEIWKIEVNFSLMEIDSETVLAETGTLSIYPETGSEESETTYVGDVIYDEDGIVITYLGLEPGTIGYEVVVSVENNNDEYLSISLAEDTGLVNGVSIDMHFFCDIVYAGGQETGYLSIYQDVLQSAGIETMKEVEFALVIKEKNRQMYTTDSIVITIPQNYDDSGTVLYEESGIKFVYQSLSLDENSDSASLVFYVKNESSIDDIKIYIDVSSINDIDLPDNLGDHFTVYNGNEFIYTFKLDMDTLSDLGIQDLDAVETIKIDLSIYGNDDYNNTLIIYTDSITIYPNE